MSIIKLNNRAVKDATAFGSITGLGNLVFISRSTASSSSSVSITSNINSTYKEYIFFFNNMHPATNDTSFIITNNVDISQNDWWVELGYGATLTYYYWDGSTLISASCPACP